MVRHEAIATDNRAAFDDAQRAAYDEGYAKALETVRYVLKLKKMGVSECTIIKKFELDPTFLHELMSWIEQ